MTPNPAPGLCGLGWSGCHYGLMASVQEGLPFRWDLVTPDQLGSLLHGGVPPDLWFLDDLVGCAGKVLARSGNGDPFFVGRSLDSPVAAAPRSCIGCRCHSGGRRSRPADGGGGAR